MSPEMKVMVVEDEPLAREGLLLRLNELSQIKIIGACASANDALITLENCQPDVIFLDIEMPGMSGVDFAKKLFENSPDCPKIIFVTAYKEFALEAFGVNAFDYLLKPFCEQKFNKCIRKLMDAFGIEQQIDDHKKLTELLVRKTGNSVDKFMHDLEVAKPGNLSDQDRFISLKSGTEWLRLPIDSINWIEAAGDYMCVHTLENTHIIRKTLKQFEEDLAQDSFIRVSRSAIVNLYKITKLSPNSNGEYIASLTTGESVKVTRGYKENLQELNH